MRVEGRMYDALLGFISLSSLLSQAWEGSEKGISQAC